MRGFKLIHIICVMLTKESAYKDLQIRGSVPLADQARIEYTRRYIQQDSCSSCLPSSFSTFVVFFIIFEVSGTHTICQSETTATSAP